MFMTISNVLPIEPTSPSRRAASTASLATRSASSTSRIAMCAFTAICSPATSPRASLICLHILTDLVAMSRAVSAPSRFARYAPARHSKAAASPLWSLNSRQRACDSCAFLMAWEASPFEAQAREIVRRIAASLLLSPSSLYKSNALPAASKHISTFSPPEKAVAFNSRATAIHFLSAASANTVRACSVNLCTCLSRACSRRTSAAASNKMAATFWFSGPWATSSSASLRVCSAFVR
mmetsp:Transcript_126507/g.316249  ORF Transcript_126507/g.316249 Transcript_126507/m.316249 type:complete len:237 (-) Transcript_126507:980-1690(-)